MFFLIVNHSIELFHQPILMHNFLYSLTICLLHCYPRHVSSINMPIFRRKNCIHTASGIFALELSERSYFNIRSTVLLRQYWSKSTLIKWFLMNFAKCSNTNICFVIAHLIPERRYQMLCEYNFSSWRWASYCSKHVEDNSVTNIWLMNKENCSLKLVEKMPDVYKSHHRATSSKTPNLSQPNLT